MTHSLTQSRGANSDNALNPVIQELHESRSQTENRISNEILQLIDKHGTVKRQLIARELERYGVCTLRDVLQGMFDMELIEPVAGGLIRCKALDPLQTGGRMQRSRL